MAQLAGERGTILKRLEKTEEDIAILGAEIEALEAALAKSEESIPAATEALPQSDGEGMPPKVSVSVQ